MMKRMRLDHLILLILACLSCRSSFPCNRMRCIGNNHQDNPRLVQKSTYFKLKMSLMTPISKSLLKISGLFLSFSMLKTTFTPPVIASESQVSSSISFKDKEVQRWRRGLQQLNDLLAHWDDKTTYCNYGEFQNELLTKDQKEQLIEKVKESKGLLDYDKSATMKVRCRRDPEMVRAYFGYKPDNNPTLYNAELNMLKKEIVNSIEDGDLLEEYITTVESFTSAKAEVNTLSYEARTDFASQQTFSPADMKARISDQRSGGRKDYLAQCKESAAKARDALEKILQILQQT